MVYMFIFMFGVYMHAYKCVVVYAGMCAYE